MTDEAALAAGRFGFGTAPGERALIARDPHAWLAEQLKPYPPHALNPEKLPGSAERLAAFFQDLDALRKEAEAGAGRDAKKTRRGEIEAQYRSEVTARVHAAVTTAAPFRERLVHFWANHFTVSAANKLAVAPVAAPFVREAIKPHVMGRFADLLKSAEQHPAMLLYLDNAQSVGPGSLAGQRRGLGLNENLAREILELHTLGVDGGYTQADVTSFAQVLTGWTVGRGNRLGGEVGKFRFESRIHEPGAKSVLGKRYAEAGLAEGEAVLADLARHPATHRHLAFKLARHFVADEPPPDAVARLARAFSDSEGDLPQVYRALIAEPAVWRSPLAKVKTPEDFLLSTLRGLDLKDVAGARLPETYALLGHRPFLAPSPQGWPDTADAWTGPDAVKTRLDYAHQVALRVGARVDPAALADAWLGGLLSPRTREAIVRAESAVQGLTLLLLSPEFQRR